MDIEERIEAMEAQIEKLVREIEQIKEPLCAHCHKKMDPPVQELCYSCQNEDESWMESW